MAANYGPLRIAWLTVANQRIPLIQWGFLPASGTDPNGAAATGDLVWQNEATRQVTVNYYGGAGGASYQGYNWLYTSAAPGWRVVAVADFNSDGRTDIALIAPGMPGMFGVGTAHSIWLSTGTTFVQAATIANNNAADTTTSTPSAISLARRIRLSSDDLLTGLRVGVRRGVRDLCEEVPMLLNAGSCAKRVLLSLVVSGVSKQVS